MKEKQGKKESDAGGLTSSPTNSNPQSSKEIVKLLLKELVQKYDLKKEDILDAIKKEDDNDLPISIFNNPSLSSLETISKYLHENQQLKFSQIASLLHRDSRTIWSAYQSSSKKLPQKFFIKPSEIKIPLSQLTDRSISVLESIVSYLKENYSLSLHQIAVLLNRNDRTIWTVYSRYKKKVMLHG
ncbi:MAG TPA: hypothetical protein VJJ21_00955 [Candidatus Nanoarchaeia archaeon]|nr:hypothetical protein [Candidatus Nanoarchaeia archaeon]